MRILGLDASTSTIGICVLDYIDASKACTADVGADKTFKVDLVYASYFKPNQKLDIFERLLDTKQYIKSLIDKYKPDIISLEEIIKFMKGKSTAATITSLAVLNRTIGLTVLEHTGKPPILLNVLTIRHSLKLNKAVPKKEEIPELVFNYFNKPIIYILDRNGKIKSETYDLADGCAVALATAKLTFENKLFDKLKKKVKKKKKKVKKNELSRSN